MSARPTIGDVLEYMAHSMLSVDDRRAWFQDMDLLLVVRMSLAAWSIERSIDVPAWVVNYWHRECERYAPGTIQLELERIAKEPPARLALLQALSHVELALLETVVLTGLDLNRDFGVRGVRFYDRDASSLVGTIVRLRKLIVGSGA